MESEKRILSLVVGSILVFLICTYSFFSSAVAKTIFTPINGKVDVKNKVYIILGPIGEKTKYKKPSDFLTDILEKNLELVSNSKNVSIVSSKLAFRTSELNWKEDDYIYTLRGWTIDVKAKIKTNNMNETSFINLKISKKLQEVLKKIKAEIRYIEVTPNDKEILNIAKSNITAVKLVPDTLASKVSLLPSAMFESLIICLILGYLFGRLIL